MARISIDVSQAGTLLCCSARQPVVIRGRIEARWQRNLFGAIEIERCTFTPAPALQTFACSECSESLPLDRADIEFAHGTLDAGQIRRDRRFTPGTRGAVSTAEEIIIAAIA